MRLYVFQRFSQGAPHAFRSIFRQYYSSLKKVEQRCQKVSAR